MIKKIRQSGQQLLIDYPFESILFLLFSFNLGLIIFRLSYASDLYFRFLVWNLFLAFLPFVFIKMAVQLNRTSSIKYIVGGFVLLSLLFLPNSPYMITDLFHLYYWKKGAPLWFDTLLIFSYAATGIVLFYATLLILEQLLLNYFNPLVTKTFLFVVIFLNAFGIYLGRYMRFNSWDIVSDPFSLIVEIIASVYDPFAHLRTWGMTLGYGLMFLTGFCCIKLLQKSIERTYQIKNKMNNQEAYNR